MVYWFNYRIKLGKNLTFVCRKFDRCFIEAPVFGTTYLVAEIEYIPIR